jgi:hypothetical protein
MQRSDSNKYLLNQHISLKKENQDLRTPSKLFFRMEGVKARHCALKFSKPVVYEWYFIHRGVMKNMQQHKQAVISPGKEWLFIPPS